jgi:bifunctional polynucleotide phosphatase/kinase
MFTIIPTQIQNQKVKGICAFDFDDTLVGKNGDTPLHRVTVEILRKCYEKGFTIIIFTNQGGVEKKKTTLEIVEMRLKTFIQYANIPIYAFAAIAYDHHRKPHIKMWEKMLKILNCEDIDLSKCLYIGDAAGRFKDGKKNKDFSCSDRKFAHNIGINFFTPEEFFLNEKETRKWEWGGFDSSKFNGEIYKDIKFVEREKEMIVLIGPQASGKSTLCEKFPNYVRINQDNLGTKAKCIKLAKKTVKRGKSIIIDNTNADIKNRKIYTEIGRSANYHIRFIVFPVEKEMAMYLDEMRVDILNVKPIPKIAFNIFYKNYRETPPTLSECDELTEYILNYSFHMKF